MPHRPAERGVAAAAVPRAPLLLFLAVMVAPGCAGDLPDLTQRSEARSGLRHTQRGEVLPVRPHWDAGGALSWGGPQQPLGAVDCAAGATPEAKVWVEHPRFEEIRCYRPGGVLQAAWLGAFDPSGSVRWRVPLLVDGTEADRVVGVGEGRAGLESGRWVSDDGRVHGHLLGESRARLLSPIAWSDDVLVQVAGGDDARALERISRKGGDRRVLPPLPRAGWLSHWQVRDLALSPDGRWLAAGLESDWRGPAPVAAAVFDLAQHRWTALEVRCPEGVCQDPRVLATNQTIGFAYRDVSSAQTVLIRYSLPK